MNDKKIYYNHYLIQYARKLRKEGTLAEVLLWACLRKKQMRGYKFTRQRPIGKYIVDFYCKTLNLAIEVDGITHDENQEKDKIRQNEIEKQNVWFLRYFDSDVRENLEGVCLDINNKIEKYEIMNDLEVKVG